MNRLWNRWNVNSWDNSRIVSEKKGQKEKIKINTPYICLTSGK